MAMRKISSCPAGNGRVHQQFNVSLQTSHISCLPLSLLDLVFRVPEKDAERLGNRILRDAGIE